MLSVQIKFTIQEDNIEADDCAAALAKKASITYITHISALRMSSKYDFYFEK